MQIKIGIQFTLENVVDLQAALQALTLLNEALRVQGLLPDLYTSGVRYGRERVGGREEWLTAPDVIRRGWGDCEDLACWRAAQIGGRAIPVRVSGGWHIVVQHPDGRIEDPSELLGMKT